MLSQEEVIRGLLSDRAKLLGYIRAIVLSPHAAEDIHQDIVVLALQKSEEIGDEQHLLAWARRVAKSKAIDYLRGRQRHPMHIDPDVLDMLEPVWETQWQFDSPAMLEALNNCLDQLSPHARKLVDLRFGKRQSGAQMSQLLGLKLQSVYMAFSRIYRTLDECIRKKGLAAGD